MMKGKKDIPMRIVKERTGLTSRQIRYYDEMGLVFPERTRGNQRLFSEEDIDRLKKIKKLLEEGYTIAAIKEKLTPPPPVKGNPEDVTLDPVFDKLNKNPLSSLYPVSNRYKLNKILGKKKELKEEK
ncbi:MerR family transcriptional regulator [Halothermothrix orenii]|uniref:Putative transcriptional regulator, MerR family n=1 Tax=Halothermothrix orenii (strain H 168 / OCM 544 / DSM 9562) TaxID=373903 RepID=B8D023_HALOH|nr:MerR family transcriptional regulator [Halothermothrix orenii]ACL70875.1 putative transcriptional regulator, MerR family [Halothermothrix orenii H 168]